MYKKQNKKVLTIDTAELKECSDIVSVVESTGSPVQVKNGNILCLCPFHSDRHLGSAMFSEKTKRFRCFACGAGSSGESVDIIQYVQQAMGMEFRDACEFVADASFSDISQFESEGEAPDKKFHRLNRERIKDLRIDGQERRYLEFDPRYNQIPDGAIVNFVLTKEEAEEYENKGFSTQKQWKEIDGTVTLTGWLIYQKVRMSAAKFAMENPEIFADLCSWKKQEVISDLKELGKDVEKKVFDRNEYNSLMAILKEQEQKVAKY